MQRNIFYPFILARNAKFSANSVIATDHDSPIIFPQATMNQETLWMQARHNSCCLWHAMQVLNDREEMPVNAFFSQLSERLCDVPVFIGASFFEGVTS
jgi:hypothetical protein